MAGHIFVTGDTHGHHNIQKLSPDNWPLGTALDKGDYLVVCGDFGLVWDDNEEEEWWRDWLDAMPWTTLFVDGNHENHNLLDAMPVERWHGGKVHFVRPGIIHLMRGQVYDICGQRILAMGGASSHDKEHRLPDVSWWERELPSSAECAEALANLDACGWEVDYIFSHEAPASMVERMELPSWRYVEPDEHSHFLQSVCERCAFKGWYHGHYHLDRDTAPRVHALYERIVPLGDALTARPLALYDLGRIAQDFPWLDEDAARALARQPRGWGNIIFEQLRKAESWAPASLIIERVWSENGAVRFECSVEGYGKDPEGWPALMRDTDSFRYFWETCWHTCTRCGAQVDIVRRFAEPMGCCSACLEEGGPVEAGTVWEKLATHGGNNISEDYPWACHRRVFGARVYDPSLLEWCPAGWVIDLRCTLDKIEQVLSESGHLDSFAIHYIELDEYGLYISFDAGDIDELSLEKIHHSVLELNGELLHTCWRCGKKGPVGVFSNGSFIACLECADVIQGQKALPKDEKRRHDDSEFLIV